VSGRIVRIDTVERLVQPLQAKHVLQIALANTPSDVQDTLRAAFPDLGFTLPGPGLIRVEADAAIRVGPLVRFLEDRGADVSEARKMQPSLEDIFVRITGIEPDAMRKEKESKGGGK